jgi:hypothetical protein
VPQLPSSVRVSTQLWEQSVRSGRHDVEQAPPEQTMPLLHFTPQPPQLFGSITVGMHVPPHSCW